MGPFGSTPGTSQSNINGFAPGGIPSAMMQQAAAFQPGYFGTPWLPPLANQPISTAPTNVNQQQAQPQTMIGIRGKIVNTADEITPQDVPMDGSSAIFPIADGSAIVLMKWEANGSIKPIRYVPEKIEETSKEPHITLTIDGLASMLDARLNELKSLIEASTDEHEKDTSVNEVKETETKTTKGGKK